ncbi:glycosyltransferase family 2 protein [Flavobacteriaceae bacterium]|nr:glycosyltransferase family 2 protein [Flavobacteriaceae bacterium]
MISILIPCYNYNAYDLVYRLEKECLTIGIIFEIICVDDASFSNLNEANQKINILTNCKFFESKKNIGRSANRQLLSNKAQYDWLLFIDVDVSPLKDNFIESYINEIKKGFEVVFGGFNYKNNNSNNLRCLFGKSREDIASILRNKRPYKYIISSNFLIKKVVFDNINKNININSYGMDYYFGALLKENSISVNHIDNEVTHYGLDGNPEFLIKTKEALRNLHYLNKNKLISKNEITILKYYRRLNFLGLKKITSIVINIFSNTIESNLKGSNPNLFLFDLYRLSYLCSL